MESKRQQKFSKLIQRDMGEIFQKETPHIFGNQFVTVSEVKMSPDLSVAKIWLSFLLADTDKMLEKVNAHKSELRKRLGNRIGKQVRIVPELIFYADHGAEHAQRIDDILSDLDIPEEGNDKGLEGYDWDKDED